MSVVGFGLKTKSGDLSYLLRRPALLVRSVVSVFVVMPVVAVLLAQLFDFSPTVERALIALAVSPMPPLLPQKETKAGGDEDYALGLMAILALLAMAVIPLELLILRQLGGRPLEMASGTVVRVILISTLLPLAAGMAVRAFMPGLGARIEKPVALIAKVLLPLALLGPARRRGARYPGPHRKRRHRRRHGHLSDRRPRRGPHAGPADRITRWCSRCRPPAATRRSLSRSPPRTSLRKASAPPILLYVLLGAIVALPYMAWHRRQFTGPSRHRRRARPDHPVNRPRDREQR